MRQAFTFQGSCSRALNFDYKEFLGAERTVIIMDIIDALNSEYPGIAFEPADIEAAADSIKTACDGALAEAKAEIERRYTISDL